jgi:hypothetical protein
MPPPRVALDPTNSNSGIAIGQQPPSQRHFRAPARRSSRDRSTGLQAKARGSGRRDTRERRLFKPDSCQPGNIRKQPGRGRGRVWWGELEWIARRVGRSAGKQVNCPMNGERSSHVQGTVMVACLAIYTHQGTRMSIYTRTPMDPTPIRLQVKKMSGSDADGWSLTWTKCEAHSNNSCVTGARR